MFWNLLSATSDATSSSAAANSGNGWGQWLMIGILFLIIVVFMVFNRRSQKKRQEETQNMLDAIKPGNKVKTIGGICGVVVEVGDDNTFVLETGSETGNKSYLKFDKQAVYQTDATAKVEEKKEIVDETKGEEVVDETKEQKND